MGIIQSAQQQATPVAVPLNSAPQIQVPQQALRSDAEVVAKVASTEIKSSGVSEASQPTREVVAKAAAQLQEFVSSMGRN